MKACTSDLTAASPLTPLIFHFYRLAAAQLINEILGEGKDIIPLGKFPSLRVKVQNKSRGEIDNEQAISSTFGPESV